MITLSNTHDLDLPMSVRSYIDGCACEFGYAEPWDKIAQIAYRVKRGANLLPDFVEDIKRHMENPAYGDYEDTAKRSIATYIEMLRTDEEGFTSATTLPYHMSFKALFNLFIEEIRYRYRERPIDGNRVECIFNKVKYDYSEIAARFESERDFVKYICTSQETLRNIDVDELPTCP